MTTRDTKLALLKEASERLQKELTEKTLENETLVKQLTKLNHDYECLVLCTKGGLA